MRYEVVEKELSRLRAKYGEYKAYWNGDVDSLRHMIEVADKHYVFIERVWLDMTSEDEGYPDKCYVIEAARVDMRSATYCDVVSYIAGFYNSVEDLKSVTIFLSMICTMRLRLVLIIMNMEMMITSVSCLQKKSQYR